jgi:hypothetical protein
MINEEVLLNNGYTEYKDIGKRDSDFNSVFYNHCDKFYQKILNKKDTEPTSIINVYYYDKFTDDGALDYAYEFEWTLENKQYWEDKLIYCLDKNMTLEEVERMLLNG